MKRRTRLAWLVFALGLLLPELRPRVAPEPERALPVPAQIRLLVGDEVRELPLEEYLVGVLAGEMPASFEPEALKAQAVAARSYTLYCAAGHRHAEADICADPAHCQSWLDETALRRRWGAAYDGNLARLREAVEATAGECLCYEGRPVFAAFHASSPGATEDCGAIWNPLPYLVSVPSPESAETVPDYLSRRCLEPLDFRDTLLSAHPEADFSGPAERWIGPLERDASGRVAQITLGGVVFRGTALRSLFSLRSTAFTLAYEDGQFCFTVTGHGHGVGLSQYGANIYAAAGRGYREILAHYYPGTTLESGVFG